MTLMNLVREKIRSTNLQPIFSSADLKMAGIEDLNNNISNYDKKNTGSFNKKVLISAIINGETYYTFDEQIFK